MPFGQKHVTLRCVQIRVPHQFCQAEDVDAGFDGSRAISMSKIVETERGLNSTFPQGPLMRWFELRHRPRPVVPTSNPSRKEILALCLRDPPMENKQGSRRDRNIANSPIGLPLPDMNIRCGR